jgi:hypothetical protein
MIVTDGGTRGTKATWCTGLSFYDLERAGRPRRLCRSNSGAGALGFRDFPGLLAAKENRTGSRQTLRPISSIRELRLIATPGSRCALRLLASQLVEHLAAARALDRMRGEPQQFVRVNLVPTQGTGQREVKVRYALESRAHRHTWNI